MICCIKLYQKCIFQKYKIDVKLNIMFNILEPFLQIIYIDRLHNILISKISKLPRLQYFISPLPLTLTLNTMLNNSKNKS